MAPHGRFDIRFIDPALVEAYFFEAGDFKALPTFDNLHEVGGSGKGIVTPHVEPCRTTTEQFHGQLVQFEIGSIQISNFKFSAR